jgi:methyl-accepting chemotaxis protein
VQNISPNTKLYTYVKGPGQGDIIAIGSTGYFREPRGGFKFCEIYNSGGKTQIADGLNRRVDRWTVYDDATFGKWITTYAPIADENGQIVGAIGVDIAADYLYEVRRSILLSGAIAFVLSYILIFLLVYWLSGLLSRPIVSLAGVAKDIGEGHYEQEWSRVAKRDTFRDEIDTLTGVFRAMVEKVAEREKSLRARVAQLEIMIDKSKLESQVQEIVDSDFFQDLQSKVRNMRNRFHDDPSDKKADPGKA